MPSQTCEIESTVNNWKIEYIGDGTGKNFEYLVTREGARRDMSNIKICLCGEFSKEQLEELLESCSYTVYFSNGEEVTSTDCKIEGPGIPIDCIGLKFDNIPDKPEECEAEQESIKLEFSFKESFPIGPVDIGFKAALDIEKWEGICGPACPQPVPPKPSRKIML